MKKLLVFALLAVSCSLLTICSAQYANLLNFNGTNGMEPSGNLTIIGNRMFGMAYAGGLHDSGIIFSVNMNGSGFSDLYDFSGANGANPEGSLTFADNKLYGMTSYGGLHHDGVIFSIDTDGSGYFKLLDFNGINGKNPFYTTLLLSRNRLFGMTYQGGKGDSGIVFSIDTNGSGYSDLLDFNGRNGAYPRGSLTLSGNVLYGTTSEGGTYLQGNVFSIDTNGTGYHDLLDFNGTNGEEPCGTLTLSGNTLYGNTFTGLSLLEYGTIFSVKTNGSRYSDVFNFNYSNGGWPEGSLTLSGGKLLGMTVGGGGANNDGVVFSVDTTGNGYLVLADFVGTNGQHPIGSLTPSGNTYYGMTSTGGINNYGVIFSVADFNCSNNFVQPICIVTTDTANNKSEIIWGRTNSPPAGGYGNFNIYKDSNSLFQLYHSQPLNELSEFVDTNSFPNLGAESYKLSTVDSCGQSALSDSVTSILLTTTLGHNVFILNWTPYVGFSPAQYIIFRGPALNKLLAIDSVANNVFTYRDTLPPIGSWYAVEAVSPNGLCIPTTHAPVHAMPSGSLSNGFNTKILTDINNLLSNNQNISIYPNPSKGIINISLSGSTETSISLVDALGRNVYNSSMSNTDKIKQINVSDINEGLYFLIMRMEDGSVVVKKVGFVK